MLLCCQIWLIKSAFVAALVGNLICPNFGFGRPSLVCLLFASRNFSSISFLNLKTKAVIPLSVVCG